MTKLGLLLVSTEAKAPVFSSHVSLTLAIAACTYGVFVGAIFVGAKRR
jgi:hypothetical protein